MHCFIIASMHSAGAATAGGDAVGPQGSTGSPVLQQQGLLHAAALERVAAAPQL